MKLKNMMIAMASGLALLMAVPAMAEDSVVLDFDFSGFTCTMPGRFDEMTGMLVPEDKGPLYAENLEDLCGTMKYRPRTLEEAIELQSILDAADPENPGQELIDQYKAFVADDADVFDVIGIRDGKTPEEVAGLLHEQKDPYDQKIFLGEKDGIQYYLMTYDYSQPELAEKIAGIPEEMKAEMQQIKEEVVEHPEDFALNGLMFDLETPAVGSRVSFEAEDLDGNHVTSEELFAKNEITLVSFWRTWCSPCVNGMPELNELVREYGPKGFGVVTYCNDAENDEMRQAAKELVSGYDFVNLSHSDSIEQALPWYCTPFTYFIDKEGTILRLPVDYDDIPLFREILDSFFAGKLTAQTAEAASEETVQEEETGKPQQSAAGTYTVTVVDQNGDAVPGVVASFCTDKSCNMAEGNADGIITFSGEPQAYHVQILGVPDGYSFDKEAEIYTDAQPGNTTITVTKK